MASVLKEDKVDAISALLQQQEPISQAGFEVLYQHYKPTLVSYVTRIGATDPEGIADYALVIGFNRLPRLESRTESSFRYYLLRVARVQATTENRRPHPEPMEFAEDALAVEDHTSATTDRLWLLDMVDQLPPDQRSVINDRFFAGLSGQETGEALDKDPNAVYQLQHRAINRLRRAAFGTLLVILAVVGIAVFREVLGPSQTIENTPVDRTTEPDLTTDEPTIPSLLDPAPDRPETTPENTDLEQDQPADDRTVGIDARLDATSTTTEGAQPSTSLPASTTTAGPTTTVATTTTDAPTTTTEAPTPVAAATRLNICAPHQITPDKSAFKLFNPGGAGSQATSFNPPAAIRFLDAQGNVLHRINTSGPMVTSTAADAHGWVGAGDGTGTYANFEAAPNPTYWAVLANASETAGYQTIQALDPSTNTWSDAGFALTGC